MGKEISTQASLTSASSLTSTTSTTSTVLPSFVDNSTLACFPPIGSQLPLGSCCTFSSTYYQFTHMTGLVRNWDAKNDTSSTKKFSPGWTYNLLNLGQDKGINIFSAYSLLTDDGAVLWADFPYDSNYLKWCASNSSWTNAIRYRADQSGTLQIHDSSNNDDKPITSETDPDLSLVKNYLNNGYVLSFANFIFSWKNKYIGNDPATTADDAFVGKQICYAEALNSSQESYSGAHQMTIVGYNDNIWTDINGNGIVDIGEKGAFKIANSWGVNDGDNGFYWIAYDALNKISSVTGAPTFYSRRGVFVYYSDKYNEMYWITAKDSYNPSLLAKFTVSHSKRSQMEVELGYSDTNSTTPIKTQTFTALHNCGGGYQCGYSQDYPYDYAFDGTGNGTGNTICDGTFTLDFSDLVKNNNLATGTTKRWYLIVTDSSADGKPVTVKNFSLINSSGTVLANTGTLSKTADGSATTTYLDYALGTSQSTWVNKANVPIYRVNSASTSYNNLIYVAGGYDENFVVQNTLLAYDPANGNSWTAKANMTNSRIEAGAATLINKIYVVGGFNSSSLNSVEQYDPSTNTWTNKANMPTSRHSLGVAAANGKIYAIGGISNGTTVSTVEEYDPTTNTWKTKTSMPTSRHSFGIVSYNGKIYVIGGRNAANAKCSTVEVYDPFNDTWDTTKASMPTSRDELACVTYNGKIYAIGGTQSTGGVSSKTEVFDPSTNAWTTLANINNARTSLNAACVNDKLYAIFGIDTNSNISNKVEEYTP
ncbi:MAG: kelch repeat-containing protein [Bacillota bacterium]|nr:kelch repeat-containing protein [Bacillota bacterium]